MRTIKAKDIKAGQTVYDSEGYPWTVVVNTEKPKNKRGVLLKDQMGNEYKTFWGKDSLRKVD